MCMVNDGAYPFTMGSGTGSGGSGPPATGPASGGAEPGEPGAPELVPPPPPPLGNVVPERESRECRLRKEARSLLHQMSHLPKNPFCKVCQETQVKAAQARRRDRTVKDAPRRFGDLLLGDHLVMPGEEHRGSGG